MGRELVFSNPKVIDLVKKHFVAVTSDDWYQRRRDDAEGKFFRMVADQGPRKGQGGSTRQGIYIFTAEGKLLAYKNAQDAEYMYPVFLQGLAAWDKLPAAKKKPGAVEVPDADTVDKKFDRTLPKGTLIVNVFTRILDEDNNAACGLELGKCAFPGGDKAARDHLWLLEDEWKSLIPKDAAKGQNFELSKKLTLRIMCFHMIDNTRGEPPMWTKEQVREAKITLTVESADAKGVSLRLAGHGLMASDADAKKAKRGFDVELLGHIHYDAATKAIDRFDLVALGDHWGAGQFTPNPRPGKAPLGIAFTLATGKLAGDLVPPQAARNWNEYLHPEKYQ